MTARERPWVALAVSISAIGAVMVLFEFTDIDLAIQDRLFNFETGKWPVDLNAPFGRAIFYDWPKHLLVVTGVALLALAVGPVRWRDRAHFDRRGLFVAILTLASVPPLVGVIKSETNVFCPAEIRRYGGDVPYVKVLERFPSGDKPSRRGRCFPAGHASGGFALIGLLWMRSNRGWRVGIIALSFAYGWWMGGYRMLTGAHYLSHTVFTMLLAVFVALAWRCAVPPRPSAAG